MKFPRLGKLLPSWKNVLLAVLAAVLLILSFPDFEYWFLAWFALVPLMWAVGREKASTAKSFVLGWIFGTIFFFGTCWWLTYAPINYAGFPPVLAYFLLFCVTAVTGLFPGIFAAILSVLLRRFGAWAVLAAPFIWVFTEFLRYWLTGNNWNAIAYSQALTPLTSVASLTSVFALEMARFGGVALVGFISLIPNSIIVGILTSRSKTFLVVCLAILLFSVITIPVLLLATQPESGAGKPSGVIIAIQPSVPMHGLDSLKWRQLRQHQVEMAEAAMLKIKDEQTAKNDLSFTVILPESPMNFMYSDDREFRQFIGDFARRNNVSVLFNSAEPDVGTTKYFNSAVMVDSEGKMTAQYDKLYLLPFGESVPWFLEGFVPGFVGNFAYGDEYDLLPVGDAKAGVMICFESHFGQLSREYVRNGADLIIEMTNDGYLGPTPILRQHLANAVFRAVETNRPVMRVTNVGITAYITRGGGIIDPAAGYTEDTRVWNVSKSDGSQTLYVRYGDWFAWLCSVVTLILLVLSCRRKTPE